MKIFKALTVFILAFTLSGCSMLTEYKESEQVIILSAVGFDKTYDGILLTAETVMHDQTTKTFSAIEESAEKCFKAIETEIGAPLLLSHCGAVVISRKLSYNEIKRTLLYLSDIYSFPLSSRVVSAENSAVMLSLKSITGEPNGYFIMKVLNNNGIDSRMFTVIRDYDISLPAFTVKNNNYILKDSLWIPK